MGVSLIMCLTQPRRGCSAAASALQAGINAAKALLYLEIHHCDVNPNIIARGVASGSARLFPA